MGVAGRGRRYAENCRALIDGMTRLGFEPMLSHNLQAPIIVTFRTPADPNYDFEKRRKELERKAKKEAKRQRKRENTARSHEEPETPASDNAPAAPPE